MDRASVNYHFGSFELLYAETLAHAHRRLVAIEALHGIAASAASPDAKLWNHLALVAGPFALPSSSWEIRLLSREIISPSQSPARAVFVESEVLPKLSVVRRIIAELIAATPDDP